MEINDLVTEAWRIYEEAKKLLEEEDIRDSAEKAWLAVETMRKAILLAAKIPYEETKKVSIAIPVFNNILIALGAKELLDKYYTFQSTLHSLTFYEGLLNEEVVIIYITEVEKWLYEAERVIHKASKIDATEFLELVKRRMKIKSEILSKNKELQALRIQEKTIIESIRSRISD